MSARCDMSDLPTEMCGHCRGHSGGGYFEHVVERQMVAKFGGSCAACGERVIAGETTIGLAENGWVCEGCFR